MQKSFNGTEVLRSVSLHIAAGERVSLIGTGGCGKTTILRLMLNLLPIDGGEIKIMGNTQQDSEWPTTLKKIGIAFQHGGLFDSMTVEQNLLFAMHRMTVFDRTKMAKKIDYLLEHTRLQKARTLFPYQLSGGMQRRVGIARALSIEPTLAIFDEPTAGLDPVTSTLILDMIVDLCTNLKSTLLIATSNVETAIRFADRLLILNAGKIIADGNWRDLLVNGSEWVKHFLSVRLVGLDAQAVESLSLPTAFVKQHWA